MESCLTISQSNEHKTHQQVRVLNKHNTKHNTNHNMKLNIKNEVTKYITQISSVNLKSNDENINHFIINSSELPKGLVLTTLE
mgnify:CR=1 FL=1